MDSGEFFFSCKANLQRHRHSSFKEQEKKLMMSLVLVIENLRNLDYLTIILKQLGERHVRYGTMKEHYPMVGAALLKTFESYLEAV